MRFYRISLILISFSILSIKVAARKIFVASTDEAYNWQVKLIPGDSLVFKNGIYRDIQLLLRQDGMKEKPIVLIAEKAGAVLFSGDVKVALYGKFTELNGIYFTNGSRNPSKWKSHGPGLVAIYANNCRITNCAFNNFDEANSAYITTSLDSNGKVPTHCRIDHCSFTNKLTFDQVINLNNQLAPDKEAKQAGVPMYHRIDHCFFSNPKKKGNAGGGIRIGYYRNAIGRCLVDSNLFIRQDSEAEIITSKSKENIYLGNTILNCQGTLNFRHGDKQVAINNFFLSDDEKYNGYGGMFVWGSSHIIAGNYFSLSKTIASRGNAAFYLNPGAEGTEHALAFGSIIAYNVFANTNGYAIHFNPMEEVRMKYSSVNNLPYDIPHHMFMLGNVFFNSKKQEYDFFKDDYLNKDRKNSWEKNVYWGGNSGIMPILGLKNEQMETVNINGYQFLKNNNYVKVLSGITGYYNSIEGINIDFNKVLTERSNLIPLRIEDVLQQWMLATLGDYYKTGKLTNELSERLKRINLSREDEN